MSEETPDQTGSSPAPAPKNLVYFVIAEPDDAQMLQLAVKSIESNRPITCEIDYLAVLKPGAALSGSLGDNVSLVIDDSPVTDDDATRLRIFNLISDRIMTYNVVLHLPVSCLVSGDISKVFAAVVGPKLHVYTEPARNMFDLPTFGIREYTDDDKTHFHFNNIYGFLSSFFAFHPTADLASHFGQVLDRMAACDPANRAIFSAQSFMNHYFLKRRAVDLDRIVLKRFFCIHYNRQGLHFDPRRPIVNIIPGKDQLSLMRDFDAEIRQQRSR